MLKIVNQFVIIFTSAGMARDRFGEEVAGWLGVGILLLLLKLKWGSPLNTGQSQAEIAGQGLTILSTEKKKWGETFLIYREIWKGPGKKNPRCFLI